MARQELTPSQRNENAGQRRNEHENAHPVEGNQLTRPPLVAFVRAEGNRDGNEGEDAEGDVDPKYPAPVALSHEAPDYRTCSAPDGPLQSYESEPLTTLAERDQVRDYDVREGYQASAAETLNTAGRQKKWEVVCQ